MSATDTVKTCDPEGADWWRDFSKDLWVRGAYLETKPVCMDLILGPVYIREPPHTVSAFPIDVGVLESDDLGESSDTGPVVIEGISVATFQTRAVGCWAAWKKLRLESSLFVWCEAKRPSLPRTFLEGPYVSGVFRDYFESEGSSAPVIKLGTGHRTLDVLRTIVEGSSVSLREYCEIAAELIDDMTFMFRRFDKHDTESRREAVNAALWLLIMILDNVNEDSETLLRLAQLATIHAPSSETEKKLFEELRENYWPGCDRHAKHRGIIGFKLMSVAPLLYLQLQTKWSEIQRPQRLFTPDTDTVGVRDARIKHTVNAKYWQLVDAMFYRDGISYPFISSSMVSPFEFVKYLCVPFTRITTRLVLL
ncbi:hypothetical protein [Crucian carp herpesvirus]|uniref:ORF100 n=1 Tax=Cyprinid herpesvirus 2 TaxID=317878 RepID=K7PBG3_CYHV2|nr:protein ORF100 [Cyprinid herpesvirus 2]APB92947.1 hypothetical protein [Crucian carp herpesvirus]AFJ20529.1 protein ORF100 [Cyprinid herpesvirus 2]AKC02046.1 hypothetical protein [Cyprinid herpesvirus 2]AMB21669.1 ORF100 [Cyprinid herpesvirus 2]QAU54822.1 protein ORF100 [Cyprinid herpesvirus 2]